MVAFAFTPLSPVTTAVSRHHRTITALLRPASLSSVVPPLRATLTPGPPPSPQQSKNPSAGDSSRNNTNDDSLTYGDRWRIDGVRQQLEFWFSATNLRRDWYLRRQMDDNGWVDPAVFIRFNRIKRLNVSLADIIAASRLSDELEVSDPPIDSFGDTQAQTRVRRSSTLPDFREWDDGEVERSFIAFNFDQSATVDSLTALFKDLAVVTYVRIYRAKNNDQPTRALVCFEDKATADAVFASFPTAAPAEAAGIVLRRRRMAPGVPPLQAVAGDPASSSFPSNTTTPLNPRADTLVFRIDGLLPHFEWKMVFKAVSYLVSSRTGAPVRFLLYTTGKPTAHVTVADSPAARAMLRDLTTDRIAIGNALPSVRLLEDPEEVSQYWAQATELEAERRRRRALRLASNMAVVDSSAAVVGDNSWPHGVVVRLDGVGEGSTWQKIKGDMIRFGKIIYLNHNSGESTCFLRFASAGEAQVVLQVCERERGLRVDGEVVTASLLTGKEEQRYWDNARQVSRRRMSTGIKKAVDDVDAYYVEGTYDADAPTES